MEDTVYGHLERAAEFLARHDEAQAHTALMAAWRVCRSPALVKVCEEVERRLVVNGLSGEGDAESSQGAWEDLARHIAWLLNLKAESDWSANTVYIDQVFSEPPNPQFGPVLVRLAHMSEFEDPLSLTKLCRAFKHVGPPFDVAPLEALQARLAPDNDSASRLAFIIRLGREWVPPVLDERAEAALRDVSRALGAKAEYEQRCASVREQWLPQVYAQLDDDAARLVMADELVALGDPWGEFIVLQCSPTPDEARVQALLEANRSSWEAPLGPLAKPAMTRFERGFPVAVELGAWTSSMRPSFTSPGPAWSMVREIDWGGGAATGFDEGWFMHPHLRGVRRMRRMHFSGVHVLGTHPSVNRLELRAPGVSGVDPRTAPAGEWSEAFKKLVLLPSLAWLELRDAEPAVLRLIASAPLARKLERLDADRQGAWRLTVRPAQEVPIEATLVSEEAVGRLVDVLRAAEGFGTQGLRVRCERKLKPWEMQDLKQATEAYAHVEWA